MREIRPSGSEGGEAELNRPSLPLSSLPNPLVHLFKIGDRGKECFGILIRPGAGKGVKVVVRPAGWLRLLHKAEFEQFLRQQVRAPLL